MGNRPQADDVEGAKTEQNLVYVRQMLGELRAVADREREAMLAYLIEMAFLEAGDALERLRFGIEGLRRH